MMMRLMKKKDPGYELLLCEAAAEKLGKPGNIDMSITTIIEELRKIIILKPKIQMSRTLNVL